MIAKIPETIIATNMDNQGVHAPRTCANVKLNTIPTKAPITINPSRPILTTPDRSLKTPPRAVKISGAEKNNAGGIMEFNKSIIYFTSFFKTKYDPTNHITRSYKKDNKCDDDIY